MVDNGAKYGSHHADTEHQKGARNWRHVGRMCCVACGPDAVEKSADR